MSDLISRQAAIDALKDVSEHYTDKGREWHPHVNFMVEAIQDLPSAQPKREKGKWIYGEDEYGIDGYRCDKCGFFVLWDYGHNFINYIGNYNFCPSCGADMRGEENDT